ncbi:hypothetical protein GUJ93_ZPchr0009g2177 [Zizania palustris]|uniref:Uncharacterized protein n=1 Tax=Zizania palustris TaxID=103762 RepID=A0A8J5V5Y3_ZIZPA|nr:hypothetical protein GUJ93_ZPchr0009g2177 [Zizania palustris]
MFKSFDPNNPATECMPQAEVKYLCYFFSGKPSLLVDLRFMTYYVTNPWPLISNHPRGVMQHKNLKGKVLAKKNKHSKLAEVGKDGTTPLGKQRFVLDNSDESKSKYATTMQVVASMREVVDPSMMRVATVEDPLASLAVVGGDRPLMGPINLQVGSRALENVL